MERHDSAWLIAQRDVHRDLALWQDHAPSGKFVRLSQTSDISTQVPAIVERHIWESAQKRLEENKHNARRNTKHDYLVGRRVACAVCGRRMYGTSRTKNDRVYTYYRCSASRKRDVSNHVCASPTFRCDQIDGAVWQWLHGVLIDPDALALGLRLQRADAEKQLTAMRLQVAMLEEQRSKLQLQLERLLDLYLEGEIDKEQWLQRRDRLEAKRSALTMQLEESQQRLLENQVTDEQIRGIQEFAGAISSGMDAIEGDFEAKRHIVDMLDVQVTLGKDEDGDKAVYASCSIGPSELCIVSEDTRLCLPGDRNALSLV